MRVLVKDTPPLLPPLLIAGRHQTTATGQGVDFVLSPALSNSLALAVCYFILDVNLFSYRLQGIEVNQEGGNWTKSETPTLAPCIGNFVSYGSPFFQHTHKHLLFNAFRSFTVEFLWIF